MIWNYSLKFDKLIQEAKTIDLQIVRDLKLKTLINVPLIVRNKVIAILSLTSYREDFQFSEIVISQIQIFAEQIASTIYKSQLLKEAEESRQLLSKQKQLLESQKKEAEDLNQDLNIKTIMKKFESFIKKYYQFDYYALNVIDIKKKIMKVLDFSYPPNTPSVIESIHNFAIPFFFGRSIRK